MTHRRLHRVCVFLGSSPGRRPDYADAAQRLGRELARRGLSLVFGGSNVGTMRVLADHVLGAGAEVVGVIPEPMVRHGLGHERVTELHVVSSMHERKQLMYTLADAFVALPGGVGTLDELFETLAWMQLGIHDKPIGILNVLGFYEPLLELLRRSASEGFGTDWVDDHLVVSDEPAELIDRLTRFEHTHERFDWHGNA